jgi:transcriptional regulator with XRE-family HTH domain
MKTTFAQIVKDEITRQGLTQIELCRRTNLQEVRISEFLNGKRDMVGRNLEKIFIALGIEVKPRRRP